MEAECDECGTPMCRGQLQSHKGTGGREGLFGFNRKGITCDTLRCTSSMLAAG